jgi:hypothetical protein
MLPLYLNSIAKRQFTIAYRGYDLDVTRALSGWRVRSSPEDGRSAYSCSQRSERP